jgi:putative FmdB family regulatory protein
MPVYQYKCTVCQERFEVEQSFRDDPLTELPGCCDGADHHLKKVFSPVGISFRGGGFYRNEARTGSSGKSKTEEAPSGNTETTTEAKKDGNGSSDKATAGSSTASASTSPASSSSSD